MSTQSNAKKVIIGTVTAVYQPGWKVSNAGNEYLAGGKVLLDSKEGVCEISFMQLYVDNERTEDMPQIWNDIDAEGIKGKRVAIGCTFDKDYTHPKTGEVKHQYKNPPDIQYLDGDEPETAVVGVHHNDDETKPTPPPVQHNIDPNQMRIMRQSTLGYSSNQHERENFDTAQDMAIATIQVAGWYLEYVITGKMPVFGAEVEADEPEEDDVLGEA